MAKDSFIKLSNELEESVKLAKSVESHLDLHISYHICIHIHSSFHRPTKGGEMTQVTTTSLSRTICIICKSEVMVLDKEKKRTLFKSIHFVLMNASLGNKLQIKLKDSTIILLTRDIQ